MYPSHLTGGVGQGFGEYAQFVGRAVDMRGHSQHRCGQLERRALHFGEGGDDAAFGDQPGPNALRVSARRSPPAW